MREFPATIIIQGQNVCLITMATRSDEFGILENINFVMALKQLEKNCTSSITDGWVLVVSDYGDKLILKKDVMISLKMETISILRYRNSSSNWIDRRNERKIIRWLGRCRE
ncbi:hypothetical protein RFI_35264 [Reticulomyxa filosa]|uniref:Uncharacterized protein n=1 Tax=Reticulomyxa filosa TaxID=46433 RepID=X6LLZ2_RETFI|nr:hypothetical protein RFI_35264 [Reticulomyxa filosa]|eukprot:ETO02172.1 hypothetical protein RFI_35264 [Reticulomyxa filosa]